MNNPSPESDDAEHLLSDLAHEFTQRLRQGESPSVEEYAQRHPDLAADIRDVFATLMLMESSQGTTGKMRPYGRSPAWQLGRDRLSEYRIVREVGRGGMGVVYEAIQETLGRRVALKVLPPIVDDRQLERFRREARATANLHHTNIVPIFDVGEAEGLHFFAMQFIDGQALSTLLDATEGTSSPLVSLARRVGQGDPTDEVDREIASDQLGTGSVQARPVVPFNSSRDSSLRAVHYRQIARLGKQVADALAYAHGVGVIHRDIKPANLLLDSRGTVWVMDFGLARIDGQDELTSPADVVGTLRYLPPERFEGHVDPRGDIYSLGITLYEILTSRPAFAASTRARLIDRILNAAPPSPRRIDPRIPRDLETIVLKAMSREPTERYPRASAMADDLDCFITDRPISARRLSTWEYTWRWCRRNRALAGMMGLAAILLITVFVVSFVNSIYIRSQLQQTRLARREARERLFDSLVSQAHARVMARSPYGRRFETLAVVRQAALLAREMQLPHEASDRLRNDAIVALCLPDEEIDQTIGRALSVGALMVDVDPQLNRYARGATDGSVTIHRVSDNFVLQRLPSPRPNCKLTVMDGVVFGPDGTYLQQRCFGNEHGDLRLWDISGTTPQLAFETSESVVSSEFSPDGQHFGYINNYHSQLGAAPTQSTIQARVIDIASCREVAQPITADESSLLIFHPTERQLAISGATAVRIIRWDTGEELSRWNRGHTQPMAWSRDGRQLLARSIDEADPKIYRWDVERRRELPALADGNAVRHPFRIVFNYRGDRFVSVSHHRSQLWEYPSGRLLWDMRSIGHPKCKFSQDDKLLAPIWGPNSEVSILRVADGAALRRLPLAKSPVGDEFHRAVLSRDGRILAAPSGSGTHLLDLETYEELAVIPGQRMPLVFDADASLLTHANSPEGVVRWPLHIHTTKTGRAEVDKQNQPSRASGRFAHDPKQRHLIPFPDRIVEVTVGAPQSLTEVSNEDDGTSLFTGLGMWSASTDGRVIATPWQRDVTGSGAQVFLSDPNDSTKYRCLELGLQHDVRSTSVSPDGKYVATGSISWAAERDKAIDSVTVWESRSGQRIKDLLVGEGTPFFSPDGKWLAVVTNDRQESLHIWRVGSWQPGPTPTAGPAIRAVFDPLNRLMAVGGPQIRLLIPETGREVARLSHPDYDDLAPTCFTPDGHRLIAFSGNLDQWWLLIWDLRLIRQGLAELGLDWNARPDAVSVDSLITH